MSALILVRVCFRVGLDSAAVRGCLIISLPVVSAWVSIIAVSMLMLLAIHVFAALSSSVVSLLVRALVWRSAMRVRVWRSLRLLAASFWLEVSTGEVFFKGWVGLLLLVGEGSRVGGSGGSVTGFGSGSGFVVMVISRYVSGRLRALAACSGVAPACTRLINVCVCICCVSACTCSISDCTGSSSWYVIA